MTAFASKRQRTARRLLVRISCREPREVLTNAGAMEVAAPWVNDKRSDPRDGGVDSVLWAIL